MPEQQDSDLVRAAHEMLTHGRQLLADGREGDAFAAWDEVVTRYGTATEPALRLTVATALKLTGDALNTVGRYVEAIAAYEELDGRYSGSGEPAAVSPVVAKGLRSRALAFARLQQPEQEIEIYDVLIDRYRNSADPAIRDEVADALRFKAITLKDLGRGDDAIAVCEDLVGRFSGSGEPTEVALTVAKALRLQARILRAEGRNEDILAMWTRATERTSSGATADGSVLGALTRARQAAQLQALGRLDEAVTVCDELLAYYDADTRAAVNQALVEALTVKTRIAAAEGRDQVVTETIDELLRRARAAGLEDSTEVIGALIVSTMLSLGQGHTDAALASSQQLREYLQHVSDPRLLTPYGEGLVKAAGTFRAVALLCRAHGSTFAVNGVPSTGARILVRMLLWAKPLSSGSPRRPLLNEALLIDRLLINNLRDAGDPTSQQVVVEARLQEVEMLIVLGRVGEVSRALSALSDGGRPVIDALWAIGKDDSADRASSRVRAATALMVRVWAISRLDGSHPWNRSGGRDARALPY